MTRAWSSHRLAAPLIACACIFAAWGMQDCLRSISIGGTDAIPLPDNYLGASIDPRVIQRMLGLRLIVADIVWIDTLIKSDIRHEKEPFTSLYHAFKTVVTLDPDDLYVYYVAGIYLSVMKDDIKGATSILKLGVDHMETHPYTWFDAWVVPWTLGYNLIFEENDVEGGSKWIQKAAAMVNCPLMIRELAKHVSTEEGRFEIAERLLNSAYAHASKPEVRRSIESKMLELGARHELYDLNARFQSFLRATKASDFARKRQFQIFIRSIGHSGKDMMGRRLEINNLGQIVPAAQDGG